MLWPTLMQVECGKIHGWSHLTWNKSLQSLCKPPAPSPLGHVPLGGRCWSWPPPPDYSKEPPHMDIPLINLAMILVLMILISHKQTLTSTANTYSFSVPSALAWDGSPQHPCRPAALSHLGRYGLLQQSHNPRPGPRRSSPQQSLLWWYTHHLGQVKSKGLTVVRSDLK